MNKQHKWHKEIKAWADGAEIESRIKQIECLEDWMTHSGDINWDDPIFEYRIKPQPKEPQYLYVYQNLEWSDRTYKLCRKKGNGFGQYVGKIKLEDTE